MEEKLEELIEIAKKLDESQLEKLIEIAYNPDIWLND